jgi:tripartite-type tricarboxylate transporter receptor subunit TctC
MRKLKRVFLASATWLIAVASLATLPQGALAQAQSYPSKAVRLIVPFPAGGATDLFARTLSQKISEKLGQPLVVENRPGAGGTLGSDLRPRPAQTATRCCCPRPARTRLAPT